MKSQDVSIKIEKAISKLSLQGEKDILEILEGRSAGIYCRNFVTHELATLVINMLGKCKKFDLRCQEQKPLRAKARRRLYIGINEVAKQIEMKKISAVIATTDIQDECLLGK